MSFFDNLFGRKEETRSITPEDVPWVDFGHGGPVLNGSTIDGALKLAPLFSAVRLISDSIASLPLQVYRQTGDTRTPLDTPALFTSPTIHGTPYEWSGRALASLLLRGNAFGLITSTDNNGFPKSVEWLHPDDVSIKDDRSIGRPEWFYLGRSIEAYMGKNSTGELLHIPWFVLPGQVLGLSPVSAFRSTVELGLYSNRFGSEFFQNSCVPSGVLETDQQISSKEEADLLKSRFKAGASGRDVALLTNNLKYRPITVSPEDGQFILTQQSVATTIAAIYGVPADMIGGQAGGNLAYSSPEMNGMALATHTLRPYLTKLEAHFSSLLPGPQYVRYSLDALLRADTKTRYESHAIALTNKWMTVAEVRALEDLPPNKDLENPPEPVVPEVPVVEAPNPMDMLNGKVPIQKVEV